ncbi:MAG TPA: hypothetical protein VES60_17340 [Nakamurella sp.]|nr:hypothetical protein [Nakamurella sp.]
MTAAWHQEMTGDHADLSKGVRAAWAKLLGCLAALGVLAMALPRPGDLVSAVVDALTDADQGNGRTAARGVGASNTAPGFLDTAENAVLMAAGLIVWVLLAWTLTIVIIAGVGRLPGAVGRTARKVLRCIAPAAAGRLVIAAVGVTAIAGAAGCAAPDSTGAAVVSVANVAATSAAANSADPSTPLLDIDWPEAVDGNSSPETPAPTAGNSPAGPASSGMPTTDSTDQRSPQSGVDPAAPVSTAPAVGSPNGDPPATTQPDTRQAESTPPDTPAPDTTQAESTPPDRPAPDTPATTAPTAIPTAAIPAPAPTATGPNNLPSSTPGPTAPSKTSDPGTPSNPAVGPARAPGTDAAAPAPNAAAEAHGSVTVQPRDTLWAIAARHLPSDATDAEIDTAWRTWYSANVEVIGADPDLIIPGQHLLPGTPEMRP